MRLGCPVKVLAKCGLKHYIISECFCYGEQVFKLIFGGTMAFVIVPIMAAMVLLAMDAARQLPDIVEGPVGTWQGPNKGQPLDATRVEVPPNGVVLAAANGHAQPVMV